MTKLAWGRRVSAQFVEKVVGIAADFGFNPSWLMAVMAFESGETFSASVQNPVSRATGLIQFMPTTALDLNTTVEALARMTPEQQLDKVREYFAPFAGRIRSLSDCYMAVLWPTAIGKAEDAVIFEAGMKAYLQNRGLDIDKDGGVTKAEATEFVRQRLERGMSPENALDLTQEPAQIEERSKPKEEFVNPIAFIVPLLQSLFSVFAPWASAKLGETLNKQVKDPVLSQQMATEMMAIVKQVAGIASAPTPAADPAVAQAQAVAEAAQAVQVVKASPALVEKAQEDMISYIERMAPIIDRMSAMEQAAWKASEDSANAAAARYAARPPDGWDMTKTLVWGMLLMMGFLLLFVAVIASWQTIMNNSPSTEVWAAVTGLIGFATGVSVTVYAFRFGYSRQSGAKDALLSELATRK
jgi:hypothetical protein